MPDNNHQNLISEGEQLKTGLYDIHHMHHYQDGDTVIHEIHHCPLFSETEMKGEEFSQEHLLIDQKLYHILLGNPPTLVYDHADKSYNVEEKEINNQKYYIITGYHG